MSHLMDGILVASVQGSSICHKGVVEKRYRVTLTEEEHRDLQKLVSTGKAAPQRVMRARVLLRADQTDGGPGKSDPEFCEAVSCGRASVERMRKKFVEEGLNAVVQPYPSKRAFEKRLTTAWNRI